MPKKKNKNKFIIGLSSTMLGALMIASAPDAHAAEATNIVYEINENADFIEPTTTEEDSEYRTNDTTAEEETPPEADENLDTEVEAGAVIEDSGDTANTESETVDEASTEKAPASEENTKDISNKETADAINTEQKDDASISADTPQETPASDELLKESPQAGTAPLDEDGLSKTEEGSELAETSEGAEFSAGEEPKIQTLAAGDALFTEAGAGSPAEENLEISEEKTPQAQQTGEGEETNEPNYAEDEEKIKDYSKEERYRSTQMEQGKGTAADFTPPDEKNEFVDGYRYHSSEPSETSEDKTQWGVEMEFDKEKGQRTYTDFYFTNTGNMGGVLDNGNVSANEAGKKIAGGEKDPNYKATSEIEIDGFRNQRNLNLYATEEDIKHINDIDNTNTTMAWQGKYLKDHPNGLKATEGGSALFGFKVNPWPNENDSLELMKLNGEYNEKVFVQGQEFDTGIKIDNIDDNAKERLVGQVYHPTTGEIVPGASAYIGENGTIHIKMPKGALKKDPTGVKYVVDDESIFSTDAYKGLQNLDVKFFARPRTADEFRAIVENNGYGYYTETGAGTDDINHKGEKVTIDKQGIDRYDHYNLIGGFKLNLDDTRHYDQDFKDKDGKKIEDHTSTKVFPGHDFSVEILDPSETGGTQKTAKQMNGAYERGEASGKLKNEFLEIANKQIADDLGVDYEEFITSEDYADKRWTVVGKSDNISKFTIKAPNQAKAGDFLALPVEYTYTNGSIDTHWFHFVVQETNNNKPEYLAEVGPQGNSLVNNPIIPDKEQDLKKNQPESYELIGNTFKDNKGNVWKVSIDQETGAVTATLPTNLPDGKEINGGEKLTVPVKVKYTDKDTGEERTEEISAQFIATKQHKTLTNETKTSEIPYETKVEYDENLPDGYFKETQAGQKGELKITFVQDTLNGKKGIFQQDGTFKEGESKIVVETTKEPTPRIIKIGTKPASTTVEIPFDTEYVPDNTLEAGETKIINDGEKGEVTITTTRNEDGTITVNQNVTKEAKNKKIKIGTKTQGEIVDTDKIPFKYKVEFDPDFYENYSDATENYKIVTPGKEGENTKTWTIVNSEKVGDPEVKITDPVDAVIKVGQKDYTGTVKNTVTKEIPYTVKVVKNPELEAGKSNVKQKGVAGSKTFEYSGEIFNGELKEGTQFTERELTDKNVDPVEEIIEIGTKPANNEETYEREVGVDVEYVYDNTKEKGYRNIEELVPGKVITKVVNEYNPETGEIETTEKIEVIPGKRKVTFGTKDFTGEYEEVDKNIIPYETEIVFDNTLKAGEKVVDQPGENGETTTKTKKHIENGEVVRSEDPVTEETKKVQNQIIRVGTMTDGKHSYTEKLPYKYEIEYDSNLKAGEYVIDVEGKEGSKTTEWSIKNSKVVEDSASVTEHTPATNAKIRVGKKDFTGNVSHEVTEEIPYDVKVIEDPTMIAGTSEVVTEGKAGSKTTKYTQGIKNGEADGKLQSEVTEETNPTQQVIKVGTKPAENKKDYSKDVNVKVEYEYNPNLDKGVVKVGDLTKGKVEIKTVNKYDPKTGEVTTTEEEKVTEATQKIIVGTKDFTGTYKYDKTCPIPFEVTITEDPNLAKGEKVVDQEGQAGSKTTYYEQDIKNGQSDGDPEQLSEKINSQPKNHIVRIGTKVAESSTVKTVERELPFKTEYIYDENLESGKEVVESVGKVGKEKVTITTKITDGTGEASEETKTITEKEDRVVRIGVKPVEQVENIPQDTTYTHNPNLEAGTINKISDGTPGKVTITTSFNKETGKLETSVTRTEPTNAEYEYGSLTEGSFTVKSEIPFNVKVIEDDTLDAGTHVVDQEGKVGKKETTVRVKNSKEESREENVITEAVDKIIRVGTKPTENMCPIPETPEEPSTPENPGEEDPIIPGTPDEEEPVDPEVTGEDKPETPEDPDKDEPTIPGTPDKEEPVDPEVPGEDQSETPEETGDDDTQTPDTEEDDQEIIPGPGVESETDTEVDESETS